MKDAPKKQDLAAGVAAVLKSMTTLSRNVTAIRKDTRFLVYCVPESARKDAVRVTIEGKRLEQFDQVCAYMRNHPTHTLYRACQVVWRKDAGGYPTVRSLHRYCLSRYDMIA